MSRRPWANWLLMAVTVAMFPLCYAHGDLTNLGETLKLGGKSPLGLVGHVFVHAGVFHLLGNMVFLWVFGNAVCAKVGNLPFIGLYFALGLISGLCGQLADPRPAVGASGAINGVVGMFVVWYLLNEISCWYAFWFFGTGDGGVIQVSSGWMVLFWLAFDVWGAFAGSDGIGYAAHVAGFVVGFATAVALLKLGWIVMDRGERSLLQWMSGEEPEPRKPRRPRRKRRTATP
jgi:membrane associated rhomboid family serine protease